MNLAHCLHKVLAIWKYKDIFKGGGGAHVGGSFQGGVFVGEGNFSWEGELDFSALIKKTFRN
jgi:hypothetical protein